MAPETIAFAGTSEKSPGLGIAAQWLPPLLVWGIHRPMQGEIGFKDAQSWQHTLAGAVWSVAGMAPESKILAAHEAGERGGPDWLD